MNNNDLDLLLKLLMGNQASSESDQAQSNASEIDRLANMLTEAGIPFKKSQNLFGQQLCYYGPHGRQLPPDTNEQMCGDGVGAVCSVVLSTLSYGNEEGLLEISGLMTKEEYEQTGDTVLGHLTAENVFERIKTHYMQNK